MCNIIIDPCITVGLNIDLSCIKRKEESLAALV